MFTILLCLLIFGHFVIVLQNKAIEVNSMVGVYVVLAAGIGLAFVVLIFERCWYSIVKNKIIAHRNR